MPETFRNSAEAAATTVVLDPGGWGRKSRPVEPPTHLGALQEATVEGLQVRLGYADRTGRTSMRVVHPLGLVHKGTTWYLVAGTPQGTRTFRVSRVRSAELLADKVERPLGFELSRAWQEIAERVDELRAPTQVSVLVLPGAVAAVRWALEGQPVEQGDIGHDGRVALTVRGYRAERVAALLAGFGRWVEVVAPPEARSYLAGVGRELVEMYGDDPA